MSTLLAVMTYPGGNETLQRHLPYFRRQCPDWIYIVSTTNDSQEKPPDTDGKHLIGGDSYISGRHLPQRLVDTIDDLLKAPWNILILAEYDTLFVNRIRVEALEHAVAAHYAGGPTWGSKAKIGFHHNPFVFYREAAIKFVKEGQDVINEGVCDRQRGEPDPPEASPDVFFTYVCERMLQPIQSNLWKEYSRNSFDLPGHLEEARQAYLDGVDVIHGCKTQFQLDFIVNGLQTQ